MCKTCQWVFCLHLFYHFTNCWLIWFRANKADNPTINVPSFELSPNSSNTTLCKHLARHYKDECIKVCSSNSWLNKLPENASTSGAPNISRQYYSNETFLKKIVNWIVGDDQVSQYSFFKMATCTHHCFQSIRSIENPELCELLLLCDNLNDNDILKHDKIHDTIISSWKAYYLSLKQDLKASDC